MSRPYDEYDDEREAAPRPATSGLATTALVFGILGLVGCWFIGPLVALICGLMAMSAIRASGGRLQGRGMALAGVILGGVGIVTSLLGVYIIYGGMRKYYEVEDDLLAASNLRQLGIAMHNYHGDFERLPAYAIADKDGKPLLSWRVAMLPYLENDNLFKLFKIDEPWDSPHNIKLLPQMPKIYRNPRFPDTPSDQTHYRVFFGPDTVFPPFRPNGRPGVVTFGQLTAKDGTPNTLLIVEAAEAVPWTKPDELPFTKDGPLPPLGSPSRNFFQFITADNSWHRGRKSADPAKIRALIHMSDNAGSPSEVE